MKRLWQFIALNIVLAALCIPLLYYRVGPIGAAAFLGAWPAFIIAIYDRFVNSPILELVFDINKPFLHRPSLEMLPKGTTWNFLRVLVRNTGFSVARNCTAELRIIKWPKNGNQDCPAPADEPKGLKWAGSNPRELRSIPARRGEAILDVLLNDTGISSQARTWHMADTCGPLIAWAATHDVYALGPLKRAQDAFCQGDYEVDITIFPENGTPKSKKYKLHVDTNWSNVHLAD